MKVYIVRHQRQAGQRERERRGEEQLQAGHAARREGVHRELKFVINKIIILVDKTAEVNFHKLTIVAQICLM